jgi:hypothetical protein
MIRVTVFFLVRHLSLLGGGGGRDDHDDNENDYSTPSMTYVTNGM